jgi:hypothetical protein
MALFPAIINLSSGNNPYLGKILINSSNNALTVNDITVATNYSGQFCIAFIDRDLTVNISSTGQNTGFRVVHTDLTSRFYTGAGASATVHAGELVLISFNCTVRFGPAN